MRKIHRVAALRHAAFLIAAIAACAPRARADAVDAHIESEMRKHHIPGFALAVVREGRVVKLAAFGKADVELDVAATPRTVFQIQSITKTFTSAAILMLAEQGKLGLDDPVGAHLAGTPETWKDITVRRLLSHTSGIKDFINEPTASLRIDVTEEEVLAATAPRPLNFPPGERYAYSNTNYHLLAMIIRKLTGLWYGDFLKERIFAPLGMSDTRIVSLAEIIPGRAAGYHWRDGSFRNGDFVTESVLSYGGGGIVSTAEDMAKWAAAFESETLLKKSTIAQAWTPANLVNGKDAPYGLGWSIDAMNGHRGFGHGGGHVTGFSSYLLVYPDDRLAVVVLANVRGARLGRLAQQIAGMYAPALAPKPPRPIEDKEPEVTALLRECLEGLAAWTLKEEKFTAEMWKHLETQRGAMQPMAAALGRIESLDLMARAQSGAARTYRYRAAFAGGVLLVSLELDKDGKIAGASVENE